MYLPRSESNRDATGKTLRTPALQRLCPVDACQQWLVVSGLTQGPLFRRIDRWGGISEKGLHVNSIIPWLRDLFRRAGISAPDSYSSHSLRRGFATWAYAAGWDLKALMECVGWNDQKSALRYVETSAPFAQTELALPVKTISQEGIALSHSVPSEQRQWQETAMDLHMRVEPYHTKTSNRNRARDHIERICLKNHGMRCINRQEGRYRLLVQHETPEHLNRTMQDLLTEIQQIADSHHCFIEAQFLERATGRIWD